MASLTDVESDNLIPYSVRKLLQLLSERKTPKSRLANIVNQMNVVDSDILDKVPQHQEQFIEDLTIKESRGGAATLASSSGPSSRASDRYGAFETIFEEGDFPDGYYHILHGSVQIWKATKLSEEEVQKQREEAGDDGGEGEAFYDKRGIHICDLATGCGFGELGFQGDRQAVRSASVVAAERTICLVSSANVYLKLMELSIKSQLRRKIDWLENCALFRHWSDEKRYEFAQSLRSYKCAKGRYVCTSGEAAGGVWFLIGGEIRVQTHLDKEKENEKAPTERRQVELALLGAGDVFGVCEHVEERREMSRSAYATKASSAYFAGTSAVLTLMFEDEVTRQLMIALTKKRRKWEALRVQQALSHAEVNVNLSAKTMLISDYLCESLDKSPKRRQPAAPRPASRPSSVRRAERPTAPRPRTRESRPAAPAPAHPLGDIPAIDHDGCGFNKVGATPVARRPSFGSGQRKSSFAATSRAEDVRAAGLVPRPASRGLDPLAAAATTRPKRAPTNDATAPAPPAGRPGSRARPFRGRRGSRDDLLGALNTALGEAEDAPPRRGSLRKADEARRTERPRSREPEPRRRETLSSGTYVPATDQRPGTSSARNELLQSAWRGFADSSTVYAGPTARPTTASAALAALRGGKPPEKPRRSLGDLDARWPGGAAPLGGLAALPAVDDAGPRPRGDAADPIQGANDPLGAAAARRSSDPLGAAAARRSSGREAKAA